MNWRCGLVAAVLLALVPGGAARADTLIDNVNGLTLDQTGQMVRFTGLVIGGDGRVKQLLSRTDPRPPRPDFRQDGGGRTLMPGFVDSHARVAELGFALMTLDVSAAASLDDALAMIAAYATENPQLPWILGRGWDAGRWGRLPTGADLARATGDRPAWLVSADGDAGWANLAALARAGVSASVADPPGGRIERLASGGAPTGVLVGRAMALVAAAAPPPLARDRDRALALAQSHLLAAGVTTVVDMGTSLLDWQSYRRAGDADQLAIRIIAYADDIEAMAIIAGPGPGPWLYGSRLRLPGVRLRVDGNLGARAAWLAAPYADAPGQRGLPDQRGSALRNQLVRAAMDGFQVALAATGDAAVGEAVAAITDLTTDLPPAADGRRWRLEGVRLVAPDDRARLAQLGVLASVQPAGVPGARDTAAARLGEARVGAADPWRSLQQAGVRLAFGVASPRDLADPFGAWAAAIARTDAAGRPFGGWQPGEAVGREAALDALTRSGAYAAGADDRIGTLMPGMFADFILLDADPTLAGLSELRQLAVQESWVSGARVFVRGRER